MTSILDRRRFVKAVLLATATSLASSRCRAKTPAPRGRVIVIGAGMSGLAAARELKRSGFDVIVLEARDRVGGRVVTDRSLGVPFDLGGNWIHGTSGNPITELASEFGAKTLVTDWDDIVGYDFDGRGLSEEDSEEIFAEAERVSDGLERIGDDIEKDISLAAAIERLYKDQKLSAFERRGRNWLLQEFVTDYAEEPERLSLFGLDLDKGFGGDERVFPAGYDAIPKGLAKGLDIRFGQRVGRIDTRGAVVRVETDRGRFEAEQVVVTLPLGVLRKGAVEFVPPLPERKRAAIANLRMGVLDKVVLRFPEVFWDDAEFVAYLSERRGEFPYFMDYDRVNGSRALIGYVGGDFARELEALSDAEVEARVMAVLRKIYGPEIPAPSGRIVTRWEKDPLVFGAYSCVPLGADGADRRALAEPVNGRLFFAGEATNVEYAATVHGAYLSGLREAKRIANGGAALDREAQSAVARAGPSWLTRRPRLAATISS